MGNVAMRARRVMRGDQRGEGFANTAFAYRSGGHLRQIRTRCDATKVERAGPHDLARVMLRDGETELRVSDFVERGEVRSLDEIGRRPDREQWGEYWRFTSQSIERLLAQELPGARCEVRADGNVLAAAAFLYGIAASELKKSELDHRDPDYEVVLSAVATKPA